MKVRRFYTVLLVVGALVLSGLGPSSVRAATINVACNANALIAAIHTANGNGQADTLNLSAGCTYNLTTVDNDTDGPNGLPSITSEITINGNGAILERGSADLRILHVVASGDLTLDSATLEGGRAEEGGGILNHGTLAVANSTLLRNQADLGGAIYSDGTMTLTNSTFSDNYASVEGNGLHNSGSAELAHSTFANLQYIENAGTLSLRNSIVAGSCGGSGVITSLGYNLDRWDYCHLRGVGDLYNTDPLLLDLADNGGPTETHAFESHSPAIDQGSCPDVTADQRGEFRPADLLGVPNADDGCDIGAFEANWPVVDASPRSVHAVHDVSDVTLQALNIENNGTVPLDFRLHPLPNELGFSLPLDEPAGATRFMDLSKNKEEGRCWGSACPTAGVPGHIGTALSFDGVDDLVTVGQIDQSEGSPGVTMGAWVYPTSISTGRHHVLGARYAWEWSIVREGGVWYVFTGEASRSTGLSVDLNQWQHIAAVFDPVLGGVRFYKNAQEAVIPYLAYHDPRDVFIGTGWGSFAGLIDEVQVYNIPLAQSEMLALYQDNYSLSWLSLDVDSGTVPGWGSAPVEVTFNSTGMPEGIHTSAIAIQSNDPNTPILHVPAMMVVGAISGDITCDTDHLIAAIHVANANGVPDTLNLEEGCTYSLTEVNNDSDGPTGLPAITSEITINGNGATIKRETWDMPDFRLFYLADTGNLTLHRLRVTGGRVRGNGGAIRNNGGTVILADSEIRENNAGSDGGGIDNAGTLLVTNSTIVHNSANTSGDGLHNSGSSTVTLHNTILAYNDGQDCAGEAITSLGYNLDSDGTCGLAAVGDVTNTDPLLDYHASVPMSGSRAIDQGSCPGTPVDLRGSLRPVDVPDIANADDGCDMGAYENVDDLMTISPTDTTVELDLGAVAVKELAIHNNSPVPLDYTVHVPAPVGGIDLLLPLDESAGATSYLDLSGQARQASCTGISCPTAGVPGKVGTALLFDGVDDSVDTNLHVDQSRDPVTVMAWVRPDSTSAGRHMVFSTDDGGYDWSLLREGATWHVFTGENSRSTGLSVDAGQWQHVAAVYDNSWGRVRFYKNGVEVVIPYLDWDASSSDLAVGNRPVTRNRPFDGRIDEVHVYNRALSATEIQAFYDQSHDLAWLSYDPGAGTIPAYSTALVQVTFDARGVSAGAYGARIGVVGGAPSNVRFRVPARMIAGLAWNEVTCDAEHLIAAVEIANVNGTADTLELGAGCVYTLTESDNDTDGPNGLPSISSSITVNGNGAIIQRRLPGDEEWPIQDPFRIFHVAASGNLTLNQLTVRQGRGVIGADLPGGYGIANRGTLVLVESTLSHNGDQQDSAGCGGGLYNFGGGNATLVNSRVTNNGVDRHSGGGGGICNDGTMTLTGSTVRGNGGGPSGGGISNRGTLEIVDSTISGNGAFAFVGEMVGDGGGIRSSGALTLRNSTVSGNSTYWSGGGISNSGTVTLTNSTVTHNDVDQEGSGCSGVCGGMVTLRSTIVADQGLGADCGSTVVSQGYNLDSDGTCGLTQPTDQSNATALLGPLQDNGGPTETHALLEGSPAIDQGSCPQTMADQRGLPRHVDAPGIDNADDACDVGAYEVQNGTPLGAVMGSVTAARTGAPLAATISVLGQPDSTETDPSGVYELVLDAGSYTLQVTATGYVTQTAAIAVVAGETTIQDFSLSEETQAPYHIYLPLVMR